MALVEINEEVFPHESLWRSSTALAKRLDENVDDKHHLILPALIMTYMAYEAFINFCGFIVLPQVWAREKELLKGKSVEAKLAIIVKKLPAFQWEKGRRPYQTITGLSSLREYISHGKVSEREYTAHAKADGSHFRFKQKWDDYLSVEKVTMARADIKEFSQSLLVAMRPWADHRHVIFDAFEGSLASAYGRAIHEQV